MSIASAQRLANFPTMLPAAPGAIDVQTAGPQAAAMLASGGTFTLNGATPVAVVNDKVTANSIIIFTLKTPGGTVGAYPAIQTITPGIGFTVAGTALDTSVYNVAVIG
jgi:hypothetical protein